MTENSATTRPVDVVLDAPASVSLYLQALIDAGRRSDADALEHSHKTATGEALHELMRLGTWATDTEPGLAAPHTYRPTAGDAEVVLHAPPEHDSLHSHVLVLGDADLGELRRALPPAHARYLRVLGDALASDLGLRLVIDGRSMQITGVPRALLDEYEARPCRVRAATTQLRSDAVLAPR